MKEIDVIMLANSKDSKTYFMTDKAIKSFHASSRDIKFNITVVETAKQMPSFNDVGRPWPGFKSYGVALDPDGGFLASGERYIIEGCGGRRVWVNENAQECLCQVGSYSCAIRKKAPMIPGFDKLGPVQYAGATVVNLPGDFNYSRCTNYGIDHGTSEWLCIANNDIFVHAGAFDKMLAAGYDSVCPMTSINGNYTRKSGIEEGYFILKHFTGHCNLIKRSVYANLPGGHKDEAFWYFHEDCDMSMQLRALGVKNAIVCDAIVDHFQGQSHPPTKQEQEWSKESTRRFFFKFGSDFGVWATGCHAGCWSKEVIFDPEWRSNYQKATGLMPNYGELLVPTPKNDIIVSGAIAKEKTNEAKKSKRKYIRKINGVGVPRKEERK